MTLSFEADDALQEPLLEQQQQQQRSFFPSALQRETEENSQQQQQQQDNGHTPTQEDAPPTTNTPSDSSDNNDPFMNRNVQLSFLLCIISGISDSIWSNVVLSGFLFALGTAMGQSNSDNTLIGAAECTQGILQLLSALPIGYVADVYGKSRIVRYGGVFMLLTIFITLYAVYTADQHATTTTTSAATRSYYYMLLSLALWGVVGGISNGPSQALFADSIKKGQRSQLLTYLYSSYLVSSILGPVVSIVLLTTLSNNTQDWSLHQIFPVFFVGVCLEIPAAIVMFFFSDKHTVVEEEEERNDENGGGGERESSNAACDGDALEADDPEQVMIINGDDRNHVETTTPSSSWSSSGKKAIPYVLFVSSLVVSLGSGASVKYFPLFFKELGCTNVQVQWIFLIVPVSIASLSFVAQRVSLKLGRIETTVLFDIIGTSLLYSMTYLSRDEDHLDESNRVLIVVVYLLRTGIMNSTYPLLESILMDNVPSKQRARWKSLESIAAFGWTGSALIGGLLADERSYRFTFSITASLQLFGGIMLVPLQPFVEAEVPAEKEDDETKVALNISDRESSEQLNEPLLEER